MVSALILAFLFRKEKGSIPKGAPRTKVTLCSHHAAGGHQPGRGPGHRPHRPLLRAAVRRHPGRQLHPIGASANITGIGILRRDGHEVKTSDFCRIGIPFTLSAVIPAYIYLWLMYGV